VIGGIGVTPDRRRQIEFTRGEILPVRQVVVTRAPHRVSRPDELRLRRVGVILGTSVVGVPQDIGVPSSQVRGFETIDGLLRGLRTDDIDAPLLPLIEAIFASRADRDLVVGFPVGPSATIAWGHPEGRRRAPHAAGPASVQRPPLGDLGPTGRQVLRR